MLLLSLSALFMRFELVEPAKVEAFRSGRKRRKRRRRLCSRSFPSVIYLSKGYCAISFQFVFQRSNNSPRRAYYFAERTQLLILDFLRYSAVIVHYE